LLLATCHTESSPAVGEQTTVAEPAATATEGSAVPLQDVGEDLSAFREAFNSGRANPRFLAILSPT
jgi:hypothetical protein